MTAYLRNQPNSVNPATRLENLGRYATIGGSIVLDQDVGLVFKFVVPTTPGSIVIQGIDGNSITWPSVQEGQRVDVVGTKVLSAGTTATGIHWFSGE